MPGHEEGFFVGPTVIDQVSTEMDVYREEIFGPVLSVVRADDVDEAIALINANPYGNGTAIFTSSGEAARRFQRGVNVGMIGINVPVPVPMAFYSFGGWKDSLFGDKHVHGPEGVGFYTRAKVVTSRWPAAVARQRRQPPLPDLEVIGGVTMLELLTVGRVGVDLYPEQSGVPLKDVATFAKSLGGTATNVAVGAARLGHRAAVLTKVGPDGFGDYVREALAGFGVDASYVGTADGLQTPVVFCELNPPEDPPLTFYRAPIAPDLTLTAGRRPVGRGRATCRSCG